MKTNTLSFRLFLFTSLWMIFSLVVVAILVSQDYRRTVEKQFENLVTANLYNLMGSIKRGSDGALTGTPQLGDSRYQQYHSGWYWTVSKLPGKSASPASSSLGSSSLASPSLASPSLAGLELPVTDEGKFDSNFQRAYRMRDGAGNNLLAVEGKVFLGEGDDLYAFRATGNLAVLDAGFSGFRQRLIALLSLFGIGLIVTSFAVVRYGLQPIRLATNQLAQIRTGNADRISGDFPREISPLIEETNALIKSNRAIVERSRTQVGNLAHSLKTPLSVMSLEVKNLPVSSAHTVQEQLSAMNHQVQTYLNRAMISARHGAITSRTDARETLARLVRTFNKLFPDIIYSLESTANTDIFFAGEQQDLEEVVGNILENAGNSASSFVQIHMCALSANTPPALEIEITDDGPGLSNAQIEYVMKRGNRLDQQQPGSGLGLSIVADIVAEYGGLLKMEKVKSGGLRVNLSLPAS